MSKVVPRAGAPISELVDDSTRQQLEALRDRLHDQEVAQNLERPRDAGGRYAPVPRDQLVRDNKTLQRMRDVTAAVGDQTIGWLLDKAQVPSVTQLTKRYSTAASRTPLLGMLAGKHLGPAEAAVLGTTPRFGQGGALVLWQPKPLVPVDPPTVEAPPARTPAEPLRLTHDAPLLLGDMRAEGAKARAGAEATGEAGASSGPRATTSSWWDSLKSFGKSLVDTAKSAWTQLKSHPLVASVMSIFVGKGYGPAHAAAQGANPPKSPTPGAPVSMLALEAPFVAPQDDLAGAVANLQSLWPKGVSDTPAPFTKQAEALQAFKLEGLEALGQTPEPGAVTSFLSAVDLVHGKPQHSHNVARLTDAFFSDSAVTSALRSAEGFGPRTADQVRAAAPWLSLGDVETPVAVLAAKRKLSGGEVREHLVPRGARAAALFEKLELGGKKTAQLISGYREADPERPLESQLVRLLDDTAALAAKPFCRRDGAVNADVLGQKLGENADRGAYHPELADLMADAARRGVVDLALTDARPDDLYRR